MFSSSGTTTPTSSTYFVVYAVFHPIKANAKHPPVLNIVSVHTNQTSADKKIKELADQQKPRNFNNDNQTHYSQRAKTPEGEPLRQRRWVSEYENGERSEVGWQMAGLERDEGGGEANSGGVAIAEFVGGEIFSLLLRWTSRWPSTVSRIATCCPSVAAMTPFAIVDQPRAREDTFRTAAVHSRRRRSLRTWLGFEV